tara:strand:- start:488 stop:805 length:318 start_codon:yes stop_codon:yes gene_type:complete
VVLLGVRITGDTERVSLGVMMASEPYGDIWGEYLKLQQRQARVPGEGLMDWIRRNPNATHKDFKEVFADIDLTPLGFEDTKSRAFGNPAPRQGRRLGRPPFNPFR